MKTMTKKERRQAQLERHYEALARLAKECGIKAEGKKLSVALLKIERQAHQAAENYCNGKDVFGNSFGEMEWDRAEKDTYGAVQGLFDGKLKWFFVNGDPRGCALKIYNETEAGRALIEKTGLQRDWGGYGLLAPEITGN